MIAFFAGAVLQITHPSDPPVRVESNKQSGGVTAGWINNYNQYVTSSDVVPSLSTELVKEPQTNGKYSLTLVFHNTSLVPIELVSVRYTVGSEIIGLEPSFGRKTIPRDSKMDLK